MKPYRSHQSLWKNVETGELITSTHPSAHEMPKGSWWVDAVGKSTWVKVNDEENGCRYGQADGPDDVVKECDCNE